MWFFFSCKGAVLYQLYHLLPENYEDLYHQWSAGTQDVYDTQNGKWMMVTSDTVTKLSGLVDTLGCFAGNQEYAGMNSDKDI